MKSIESIHISLASPERILSQSGGEVTSPECFAPSGAPTPGGLFDQAIFGIGGHQMGHVILAYPACHPWFLDDIRLLLGRDELPDSAETRAELASLDLESMATSSDDRGRLAKTLLRSGVRPEWMALTVLAVVPFSLRPMVQLSDGQSAGSDLNELYRTVIARNNRIKSIPPGGRLMENAVRMLDESVRALLVGDGSGLTSLTEALASGKGLMCRNLDGKRQDFSGKSVLVSGPEMRLDECGMPIEMAIDLFRPFIARKLVQMGCAPDMVEASAMTEAEPHSPDLRRATEAVAAERLILLNRAPTFNRMALQPFRPVLVEHRGIAMHPLLTAGFNADFDGDQAAIHIPLSDAALSECRHIFDAGLNLVNPGTGRPAASPVQDMVLGLYYLTADPGSDEPAVDFESIDQAIRAVDGGLGIHRRIRLNLDGRAIKTTAGRAVLNSIVPERLGFADEQMTRQTVSELVSRCLDVCGRQATVDLLDALDDLGFRYATQYAATLCIGDLQPAPERDGIIRDAWEQDSGVRRALESGEIDRSEAVRRIWQAWDQAFNRLTEAVKQSGAPLDPPYAMVASGSRGSFGVLTQLTNMAAMASVSLASGEQIEVTGVLPIPSSRMEGLSPLQHFAASFSARRGLTDTHVRIDDAAKIMQQLERLARDYRITSEDCGDESGAVIEPILRNGPIVEGIADRIAGRYAAQDITLASGETIVRKGELIDRSAALAVEAAGIRSVRIRSVLTCGEQDGVCSKCYGLDLSAGAPASVGAWVGVIAAESVSEPGIQLTRRTYYYSCPPGTPEIVKGSEEYYGLGGLIRLFDANGIPNDAAWLARTVTGIYREQGVPLNDKHAEVIARLMSRFVRVTDPGDTDLIAGEPVKTSTFERINAETSARGARPAIGEPVILAATRAATLGTDSFLVKAVLSDAPSVLAQAALSGSVDDLNGIRERLITGLPLA